MEGEVQSSKIAALQQLQLERCDVAAEAARVRAEGDAAARAAAAAAAAVAEAEEAKQELHRARREVVRLNAVCAEATGEVVRLREQVLGEWVESA